jgi:hypothetical protein
MLERALAARPARAPNTFRRVFFGIDGSDHFPALHAGSQTVGVDALHNNVFGTKIMKDGSQRREPETSVFVPIARRMEPEHPAVRLKGHSA